MKRLIKIIFSLVLVIVFLFVCIAVISIGYFAAILHTYKAFTAKTPVAEITISQQKQDSLGAYSEVNLKLFDPGSALATFISSNGQTEVKSTSETYKLYGDVIYFGGPIIKFEDGFNLLGFKTIYKVGKIFARYDLDIAKENIRTDEMASNYDLNGGLTDWKSVHDNLVSNNILGFFYRLFIDTTEVSAPGMYVSNKPIKYTVYITNDDGFIWNIDESSL